MMDEPLKAFDNREKQVLRELEKQYEEMLAQLTEKVERMRQTATDMLLGSDDARMNAQSKIYQYEYQKALRDQISTALDQLRSNEFDTINDFLQYSYQNGYVGTMYDFAKDGVPLVTPIDQNAVIKAIQTDSKLQKPLYDSLGIDTAQLKKAIRQEVSRGLATNLTTDEIARNLSNASDVSLKRAKVIARTESHRIRETASFDAGMTAKENGADIVKKWEATLDERTRETHRRLDGQFRELEDAFEIDGKTAMFPGSFGRPEEDCNCHCRARKIARWMLDDDELQYMHQRAAVWGLENDAEKVVQYREFENKFRIINATVNSSAVAGEKEIPFSERGIEIEKRLQNYLQKLAKQGDYIVTAKDAVSFGDISVMTAETGVEFTKIVIGNDCYVIRGGEKGTLISEEILSKMMQEQGIWECHSHPFIGDLIPSENDILFLNSLKWQENSVIIDPRNQVCVFTGSGVIEKYQYTDKKNADYYESLFEIG